MNAQTRPLYIIIGVLAVLLACSLLGGGGQGVRASGDPTAADSTSSDGRYKMMTAGGGTNPYVYLLDTRTGRCWIENSPGDSWREVTPALTPPAPTP